MLILAFAVAALAHRYLQTFAPSNAIAAKVRREQPRLRVAAGLLVLSGLLAAGAFVTADWVTRGGPGWLHLVVLIAIYDAFKFALLSIAVALRRAGTALRVATRHQRSWSLHGIKGVSHDLSLFGDDEPTEPAQSARTTAAPAAGFRRG
jgi:hypothetical protein